MTDLSFFFKANEGQPDGASNASSHQKVQSWACFCNSSFLFERSKSNLIVCLPLPGSRGPAPTKSSCIGGDQTRFDDFSPDSVKSHRFFFFASVNCRNSWRQKKNSSRNWRGKRIPRTDHRFGCHEYKQAFANLFSTALSLVFFGSMDESRTFLVALLRFYVASRGYLL